MTRWLEVSPGETKKLVDCATEQVHVFDQSAIRAVNAALAAKRPLLVRGEPGTGKSQLALAAATAMNRPYLSHVVDSRTTAHDLVWQFDAVARLAEAQLSGALGRNETESREKLDVKRFVSPGPLWWALDWQSADEHVKAYQCGSTPPTPKDWDKSEAPVVLIDEIDKADSDVPNGLLDVLGSGRFKPQGYADVLCTRGKAQPLVIITTNEERSLPDAFLRRCLVLHINLPKDNDELVKLLVERGLAHFPQCAEAVLQYAANQLVKDRTELKAKRLPAPGQAEYLDLVRAVIELGKDESKQLELLDQIALYALQKPPKDPTR
jgi:MoxR-like ATPase